MNYREKHFQLPRGTSISSPSRSRDALKSSAMSARTPCMFAASSILKNDSRQLQALESVNVVSGCPVNQLRDGARVCLLRNGCRRQFLLQAIPQVCAFSSPNSGVLSDIG